MAIAIGDLGRERKRPLFARRPPPGPGERSRALRKGRRRRVLRPVHVLGLLALQAGFFLAVREAYLFLITWEELTIRKVVVDCAKDNLRRALEDHFAVPGLGNILLCDLDRLRADIRRVAWVKDASVQKVFPSTLRISVVPRTPFALLERNGLGLADEEGRVLERADSPEGYGLPVVSAADGFAEDFFGKWAMAARCLRELPRDERDRLAAVRCDDDGSLELVFKDDPVRLIVGGGSPAADLARFRARRTDWEAKAGPLASVDLSYHARVFLKTAAAPEGGDGPPPDHGQGD
jgi:cell division septal protein FtsQ